jgi:hypothetical protein
MAFSQRAIRRAQHVELYQRKALWGFSTWELRDCGALAKDDAKPSNLGFQLGALRPLFRQERWLRGCIPLPEEQRYR